MYKYIVKVGSGPSIIKSNRVQIMTNQPFVILYVSGWYIIWKTLRLKLLKKCVGLLMACERYISLK